MIREKENGETEIKESKTNIVKTGGKLYIAGEYSVLIPNQSAIIKSIDIFMKAEIKFSEKYSIYSDMYDYSVTLEEDDKNYSLITETVNIVNEYLQLKGIYIKPFNMKITGKMEKNGIEQGNKEIISENIEENGKLLSLLHKKIYSQKLLELVESAEGLDICAKSSGAGGGDCGIAISFNKNDTEKLLERWESRGIELLYKSEL